MLKSDFTCTPQQPFRPLLCSAMEQASGEPYSISPASAGSTETRPSSKNKSGNAHIADGLQMIKNRVGIPQAHKGA